MSPVFFRASRLAAPLLLLALSQQPSRAEEPSGCDKFKWPIARQQAALAAEGKATVADGGALAVGTAARVSLAPVEKVHFAQAPERAPAPGTYAAVLTFAPSAAAVYTVSLSEGAWVDVFQDSAALRPLAFSGAKGCPNIHKSLKFQLAAQKTVIQVSNSAAAEISIVVLPE
jgi:hypothetical protein